MTWDVVLAVAVRLVVLRAAGSEFHFSLVEMSGALPGLHVFCNGILNMSDNYSCALARSNFKIGLMLTIVIPSVLVQALKLHQCVFVAFRNQVVSFQR